jgi:hypothetical protein
MKDIPTEIIIKYKLHKFIHKDATLLEILTGMYGLPQAGRSAQEILIYILAEAGYSMDNNIKCLFKHTSRNIMFTLTVHDFGIKYTKEEDLNHLVKF